MEKQQKGKQIPKEVKKERKRPQGEFRDKERTKMKLLQAVGEIIRTEGYTALGVNKISHKAGVNKKLIYRYFDNVDSLIEKYVREKDYWASLFDNTGIAEIDLSNIGHHTFSDLLDKQLDTLYDSEELKNILLWEISENNALIRELAGVRENRASELLKLSDSFFDKTSIDLRALTALQTAGIYYLILHARHSGDAFCEIDMNTEEGKNRIKQIITQINTWAFKEVKKVKR